MGESLRTDDRPHPNPSPEGEGLSASQRKWTLRDQAKQHNSPPLQGRGRGWGLSAERLADLHRRARDMRRNPTEPEKRLWRNLSNGQLAGFKFRRQEVIGRAIVDFFCPSAKLCVEADGETHADTERDRQRDIYLNGFGYTVLHVTNLDVMQNMDGVLQVIQQALGVAERPHPNPSPESKAVPEEQREGLFLIESRPE